MTDNIIDMQKPRDNNVTLHVGIYRDPEYIFGDQRDLQPGLANDWTGI